MPPYAIVIIVLPRPLSGFGVFHFFSHSTNTYTASRTLGRDWQGWTHL